ncbi:MAG: polymorphic toxin type 24 domain-containing protein, partial [Oscillospiraceae bacterium]|nr:polymorphic toxin type 24 domain-containing protein [Oscillospiraceae bacterium]
IGIGITVFCGTIFNLVRVLKPYISGGSKGNKPVGDQGKKSDGDSIGAKDNGSTKANTGRAKNKIQPDKNAEGAHTVIKRDPKTGEITNYRTYEPNPQNPSGFDEVSGYDGVGGYHTNKVTGEQYMPHVHDKTVPGGVRSPRADEIPGYMEEY